MKLQNDRDALWAPPPAESVARDLCTDCGISRSSDPKRCGSACQFIKPDYETLEAKVHGRARDPECGDERFLGPYRKMVRAALREPREGAQWTGITTRIAERLLETKAVDAVLTMAPDPEDKWRPVPVIVTSVVGMAQCRGMRMGYAPPVGARQRGQAAGAGSGFMKNVERAAGGLPLRGMPNWLRPLMGWLMPKVGPRGLEFARARLEMKAVETVLHLRRAHPRRMRNMIPDHVWRLVAPYGLAPKEGERDKRDQSA